MLITFSRNENNGFAQDWHRFAKSFVYYKGKGTRIVLYDILYTFFLFCFLPRYPLYFGVQIFRYVYTLHIYRNMLICTKYVVYGRYKCICRDDGKRFESNRIYPSTALTALRLCGVNMEYINTIHTHTSKPHYCQCIWVCVCACYRKPRKSNPPDGGKAFHARTPSNAIHDGVCLFACWVAEIWIVWVCAGNSQHKVLGNRHARNSLVSVLRQPSLCKVIELCILFSAHIRKKSLSVFFRSTNFFFSKFWIRTI